MCGIFGILDLQQGVTNELLSKATRTLFHRGPDGIGTWTSNNHEVGFGHARLSIIDLDHGSQPLFNEEKNIAAVVNGEFYDFERIRAELEAKGHVFRTLSDSEILIHLYEEYGLDCLTHLRGEFAFLLWDEKEQRLFAARDRFGIKPIFYAMHLGKIYFASEAKAIFAAGFPAAWDEEGFYQSTQIGMPFPNKSLFKGISQIPAGHFLTHKKGETQVRQYWDFDYPTLENTDHSLSEAEHIEHFKEKFIEAIRLRMRADVPVACYLSGGLDSCSILGFAAQLVKSPIAAFNLTFDHDQYNEEEFARETAQLTGSTYHPVAVNHSLLAENFSQAVWHTESLCFNAHGIAKFLLSAHVRKAGFKVVLTGEGSDEILAGYPHFRRDLIAREPNLAVRQALVERLMAANSVSKGLLLPLGEAQKSAGIEKYLGFTPTWMQAQMLGGEVYQGLYASEYSDKYRNSNPALEYVKQFSLEKQLAGTHPVHQSMYLWSKGPLASYILNILGDRMEMAHSIEGRVPFLDHHLVEVVKNMPLTLKIKDMTEKFVLREAAKEVITKNIYLRQKHPFLAPPSSIKREEPLFMLIQDTLRGSGLKSLPFLESKKVQEFLDTFEKSDEGTRASLDPLLMSLTSAVLLAKQYQLN